MNAEIKDDKILLRTWERYIAPEMPMIVRPPMTFETFCMYFNKKFREFRLEFWWSWRIKRNFWKICKEYDSDVGKGLVFNKEIRDFDEDFLIFKLNGEVIEDNKASNVELDQG